MAFQTSYQTSYYKRYGVLGDYGPVRENTLNNFFQTTQRTMGDNSLNLEDDVRLSSTTIYTQSIVNELNTQLSEGFNIPHETNNFRIPPPFQGLLIGSQGVVGATGSTGFTGVTGFDGVGSGANVTGTKGSTGDTGPTGTFIIQTGPQGGRGSRGIQGFTGPQGPRGPVGTQGAGEGDNVLTTFTGGTVFEGEYCDLPKFNGEGGTTGAKCDN